MALELEPVSLASFLTEVKKGIWVVLLSLITFGSCSPIEYGVDLKCLAQDNTTSWPLFVANDTTTHLGLFPFAPIL